MASTTIQTQSKMGECETPNFTIMSYGDPPAKYRSAIPNHTLVDMAPFGTGGADQFSL